MLGFSKNFLFIFLMAFATINAQKTIKEKHVQSYTQQCLEYWFFPNHENSQLKGLSESITTTIINSNNYETTWNWNSFGFENLYPLDYVEQSIRGGLLEFVKEASYKQARKITNNAQAQLIASTLYDRLLSIMSQSIELERGIFAEYIGSTLAFIVQTVFENLHYCTNPTTAPITTYPSDSCIVCMEDFYQVTRVFLKPCGHDMCVNCAERWFFTENKSTCPLCRAKIDKKALRQSISNAVYTSATTKY
jgi:hypothetical protein